MADDESVTIRANDKEFIITLDTLANFPESEMCIQTLALINRRVQAAVSRVPDDEADSMVVPIKCDPVMFTEIFDYLVHRGDWYPPTDVLLRSRVIQLAKKLGVKGIEDYIQERARVSPNLIYNYLSVTCNTRLGKFYIPLFAGSMYDDLGIAENNITDLTEHFEIPIGDVITQHKIIGAPYRHQYRIINVTDHGEMRTFHYHVV